MMPFDEKKLTGDQLHYGAMAHKDFKAGKNPPSWVTDEAAWDKAKEAALKSYTMDEDAFWPAVVHIYENMGGSIGAASAKGILDESALRASFNAPEKAAGQFMVMPGGTHEIHCSQGNRDVTATVLVDQAAAAALEAQRATLEKASAHKPYFDFDHNDQQASFWPTRFVWADQPAPGIYAQGTWSKAGKEAVEGQNYRAFSPKFHVDNVKNVPARIVSYAKASLNMGGLVNDPAFKSNLPLWAKQAGAYRHKTKVDQMTAEELAALHAKIKELEQEIEVLKAKSSTADVAESLVAKQHELEQANNQVEIEELRQHTKKLEDSLLAQRTKDADEELKKAVSRGAIAVKDIELQAKWKKQCIEDPDTFIPMLRAMRSSPALEGSARPPQLQRLTIGADQAKVSRASNENMLTGMVALCTKNGGEGNRERKREAAREFAALYASELIPRLAEGDDIPLRAANTLGTLAATIASTRTLELLTLTFPILKAIASDFSDQIVSYGDTLKTRVVGIPTVQTYNTTTGWPTDSDVTTTDISITYDQFKGVPIKFLSHEITGTVRRLFDEIAPAQAYALGKDMVDFVYALITSAFTNTVTAAGLGTFGRSTLIDVGGILDDAGNPDMGRTFLLARPYYSALAKDQTIITLAAFQRADIITGGMEGQLRDVEGFYVVKAVNLPGTAIGGAVLKGFAFTKSALCLATRLSADYIGVIPGAANGILTVVTAPNGLSANQVQFVDNKVGSANQRLEVIYGANRGQVAAGALLTDV